MKVAASESDNAGYDSRGLAMKMAVVWFFLFSISSLCTTITIALYGMRWDQIEPQDKLVIVLLIVANWFGVLMAFFSKAIARVQHGEFPLDTNGDGHPAQVKVTTTTAVTETPVATTPVVVDPQKPTAP